LKPLELFPLLDIQFSNQVWSRRKVPETRWQSCDQWRRCPQVVHVCLYSRIPSSARMAAQQFSRKWRWKPLTGQNWV